MQVVVEWYLVLLVEIAQFVVHACHQVEVFIPWGGNTVSEIFAWEPSERDWVSIYRPRTRDLDGGSACKKDIPLEYVQLYANPCGTTFATDTIRVVFDTDLTNQWLEVDAVRLTGVKAAPYGVVTSNNLAVEYVPDKGVYGVETFSYVVSDCPFTDASLSEVATLTINIDGVNNPPEVTTRSFVVSSE